MYYNLGASAIINNTLINICAHTSLSAFLIISLGDSRKRNYWVKSLNILRLLNTFCHIAFLDQRGGALFPHTLTTPEWHHSLNLAPGREQYYLAAIRFSVITGTSALSRIFVSRFHFLICELLVHVPYPLPILEFSVFLIKVETL